MQTLHARTNIPLSSAQLPTFFQQPPKMKSETSKSLLFKTFQNGEQLINVRNKDVSGIWVSDIQVLTVPFQKGQIIFISGKAIWYSYVVPVQNSL